jgi:hypothetical protein
MTNQKRKELAYELRHEEPAATASRYYREERLASLDRRLDELGRLHRERQAAKRERETAKHS